MKIRNVIVGFVLLAVAFGITIGHAQTSKSNLPASSTPGRFQLYQGEHFLAIAGAAAPVRFTDVLRIDTQTGETKLLVSGSDQNGARNFWQKIDEGR